MNNEEDSASQPADWEPHRELLHGIQHLRRELGADFQISAAELRITDPTPAGIARQLQTIRKRAAAQVFPVEREPLTEADVRADIEWATCERFSE